jgi:2-oxo-4-hydroxy-4-carboxy--5-ureidoimidazoline (OHCU) decarboxylase
LDSSGQEPVYQRLAELNREYEARHGFRFVVFVNGRSKSEIVKVLEARMRRPSDEEMRMALSEILAIARDRLRSIEGGG